MRHGPPTRPKGWSTVLACAPGVLVEVLAGEAVLMQLPSRALTRLDAHGTAAWLLLTDGRPVEAAAEELAARHGAPVDVVRQDLVQLVDRLVAAGLLVRA